MSNSLLAEFVAAATGLWEAPHHRAAVAIIVVAVVGGWLLARPLRARLEARAAALSSFAGGAIPTGGLQRIAFPLATLMLLGAGELLLRLSRVADGAADVRLIRLAMVLVGAMAFVRLVVYVMRRVFPRLALLAAFERGIAMLVWLAVALHVAGVLDEVTRWLQEIALPIGAYRLSLWDMLAGALALMGTLLIALWIGAAAETRLMRAEGLERNVRVVLSRVVKAVALLIAVLLGLSLVGIDLTVLSVFGGALGVGLGLGLQRIASNYVSGFIILLDRSIEIGDTITVDRYSGAVTQINTRYTVIRAPDGTEAIVPNEKLVSEPVTNLTYSDTRVLLRAAVLVGYESDIDVVLEHLMIAARDTPRVLPDPAPVASVTEFAADGIGTQVSFWIHDPENGRANVLSDVNRAILNRFREHGIEIPFPRRDVRVLSVAAPSASGANKLDAGAADDALAAPPRAGAA